MSAKEVMRMLHFGACPRCGGDMYENRDRYGAYKECLMCGMMADIDSGHSQLAASRPLFEAKLKKKEVA